MGIKRLSGPRALMFFYLFDVILVLAVLVFVVPQKVRNRSTSFSQSSLVEKGDFDSITRIEIKNRFSGQSVTLKRMGDVWTGTDMASSNSFFWPADKSVMDNFFLVLSRKRHAELKSTKHSSLKSFELDDIHATSINFTSNKGSVACYLFGKVNSLESRIAFRKWGNNTVWEIDDDIASYIEESADFWCDPYLCPQYLTGLSKAESESFLRHGKLFNMRPPSGLEPMHKIRKDFGNGAGIDFSVYQKENLYIVIPVFCSGIEANSETSEAMKMWNYRYEISKVTLEKFLHESSE